LEAAAFVRVVQDRQKQLIASPEEIAFTAGWIGEDEFIRQVEQLGNTDYGRTLRSLLRDCKPT
jgi:glucose-1-phosphate thymidylyltransferase